MNSTIFSNVQKIIAYDSKTTTYKFALLRGTIDIITENSPFILLHENSVSIPLGLLIEKWIIYYYPIFEAGYQGSQINGEKPLGFASQFLPIIEFYNDKGGLSFFYNELRKEKIDPDIQVNFLQLTQKLKTIISDYPMRYIGKSVNDIEYSIYKPTLSKANKPVEQVGRKYLIENYGNFSIPFDYYEVFRLLGSFLSGQDAIMLQWSDFAHNASQKTMSKEHFLEKILVNPITERDVKNSKDIYSKILQKEGTIHCVWSGVQTNKIDVDHILPFAIWKNNDLWNLLPATPSINNNKRDKIPSLSLIDKQKNLIIYYWELVRSNYMEQFDRELFVALTGNCKNDNWQNIAILQLKSTCDYLINTRGYKEWNE
jgi:HNH endonuclease